MRGLSYIALLCTGLVLTGTPSVAAPDTPGTPGAPAATSIEPHGFLGRIRSPYQARSVAPVNLRNSNRLDALIRAGDLYLSLQDAIALALENNIDIEVQRYAPQIADANLLHAQAGGFAAPVSLGVLAGPGSVTGAPPSSGLQAYIVNPITQSGFLIPSLDPALIANANWAHQETPQSNTVVTGTESLLGHQNVNNVAIQKYLTSGTLISLGLNNNSTGNNGIRTSVNPATNSNLSLSFTQHLLQGFGPAINGRQIRIAKNNREVSDLTFKAQVIATITALKDLYWDLVSYREAVRVQQDALAADERLHQNNLRQVEVGTLAPIEVTRAEAQIAADQQALTVAQTSVLQQETILKNAMSRIGVRDPILANVHIIPTDRIQVPDVEAVTPIQESMALATSARPELAQFRILIQNQEIGIKGVKNELLPTLDLVANLTGNGLAGQPCNRIANPQCIPPGPLFVGGYGDVLTQIFSRNFPNYSAGFSLNIPIHNRAAQADVINSEINLRQQQASLQRLENQVRVEVQNAVIGVQQTQAQYRSAELGLKLQQQTVDAEQKKLDVGASTVYNVILTQRDLVTAESNLVAAEDAYAKAKVELDRSTGQTLYNNDISIDEAFRGAVSRPPSPIPAVPPAQTTRP